MVGMMVELGGIRLYETDLHNGWGLAKGGLPDWWDSPDTRGEDDPLPGFDGEFDDPDVPLLTGRRVTVRGLFKGSTQDWVKREAIPKLNALTKSQDLGFRVWDADRWVSIRRARIRGRVRTAWRRHNVIEFEVTVSSADPLKYGEMRQLAVDPQLLTGGGLTYPLVDGSVDFGEPGGVVFPDSFTLENIGAVDYVPERFTIVGPVAGGFTITSDTHVLEYTGTIPRGQSLVLTPFSGGRAALDGVDQSHRLIRAGWATVPAFGSRGYRFNPTTPQPGARLLVDYPEGAWI